eukprot:scpid87506/ scgid31932/ 
MDVAKWLGGRGKEKARVRNPPRDDDEEEEVKTIVVTEPDYAAEASQPEPDPVTLKKKKKKKRRRLPQSEYAESEEAETGCSPSDGEDSRPAKRTKKSQFSARASSEEVGQYDSKHSQISISRDPAPPADEASTQPADDPQLQAKTKAKLQERLAGLQCYVSNRYPVRTDWITSSTRQEANRKPVLDLVKIFDPTKPKNYSKFVSSLPKPTRLTSSLPSHPRSKHLEALRRPFGAFPKRRYDICGTEFEFSDHVRVLTASLKLAKSRDLRVVFTPSKGRHATAHLHWSCPDTLQVLLVPREEHDDYRDRWAAKWLVVSTEHHTIGATRNHILKLARHWHLDSMWMVDDSVPTTLFYRLADMQVPEADRMIQSSHLEYEPARVEDFSVVLREVELEAVSAFAA